MHKFIATILTGAFVIFPVGPATPKPVQVWEDPSGDAGNQDSGIPGASQAGFDLVGGSIAKVKQDIEFTTEVAEMPATGALPEGFRFLWHFAVDGEEFRLTIKSQDIGEPDLVAQQGTERIGRIDMDGHFRLEECYTDATLPVTLSQCTAIEYLEGVFDPAEATFTAIVPMKSIKAKKKSLITGGTGGSTSTGCQICWIPHYAERSLTPHTIIDSAVQASTYKVPKK